MPEHGGSEGEVVIEGRIRRIGEKEEDIETGQMNNRYQADTEHQGSERKKRGSGGPTRRNT